MTPTLSIQFTPQAQAVLAKFETLPRRVLVAIKTGLDDENRNTVSIIQRDFMSFPKQGPSTLEGLRVQSNRLRASVRASKAIISGDTVTAAIGSNVKYAALHEFGGVVHHPARAGSVRLRTDARGNLLRQGANGKLAVFAKKSHKRAKTVSYQGQAYDVTYPARRPFLRGIQRNLEGLRATVSRKVVEAAS